MLDTKTVSSRAFCCGKTFRVYYPPRTTHSDTFGWTGSRTSAIAANRAKWTKRRFIAFSSNCRVANTQCSILRTQPNDASACSLWQSAERTPKYFWAQKHRVFSIVRKNATRFYLLRWGKLWNVSPIRIGGGVKELVVGRLVALKLL